MTLTLLLLALAALWIGWRLWSRKAVLPCPAEFAWLVEMENPIARATRSERIVALLAPKPGARLLDIGCGPGRVAIPLARAVGPAGEVVALDLQPAMLGKVTAKATAAGLANVRPLQADLRETALPGAFDGAVLVVALGEIPGNATVLPAIFQALKRGGTLVVTESVFDPHFTPRRKVRAMAATAGFAETGGDGNAFGYSLRFEKPDAP
jgi:ubiquinone/menaquinone biosynthesis C-methylase UbiE